MNDNGRFDEFWSTLSVPGEFDAMDDCDKNRWRGVVWQAFLAGTSAERERHRHEVHSCHDNCKVAGCVSQRLRKQLETIQTEERERCIKAIRSAGPRDGPLGIVIEGFVAAIQK